jgi:hypothetical protein
MDRDEAATFLLRHGCEDSAVASVLDEAKRFPGRFAYTENRWACVVYTMPGGTWDAQDSRATEEAIRAYRRNRR